MAERTGASQEIGTALLKRSYRLFHWWHIIYQSCGIAPSGNAPRVSAAAIEIGSKEKSPLAKTVRTCRKLLKIENAKRCKSSNANAI
jgi:transposase